MTDTFNTKEWDVQIAQHARKGYLKQQAKRGAVTLSVCVLAVGLGMQTMSEQPTQVAEVESIDALIDQQVVAVYESAVELDDHILMWDY